MLVGWKNQKAPVSAVSGIVWPAPSLPAKSRQATSRAKRPPRTRGGGGGLAGARRRHRPQLAAVEAVVGAEVETVADRRQVVGFGRSSGRHVLDQPSAARRAVALP